MTIIPLLLGLLLALMPCTAAAQNRTARLVFADEFDSPQLDTARWSTPPRGTAMWSRWIAHSPDVVYQRGGLLVCRAVPRRDRRPDSVPMHTGAVWTRGKFALRYGRVEVRMRTNRQPGNFAAAWLVRTWGKGQTPPYAEIDIAEMVGTEAQARHAWHTQHTSSTPRHGLANDFRTSLRVARWHVYAVEWTPTHIAWTVDGREVARHRRPTQGTAEEVAREWTFDSPCHLILNQSIMHGAFGIEARLDHTYETEWDWVRVYSLEEPGH